MQLLHLNDWSDKDEQKFKRNKRRLKAKLAERETAEWLKNWQRQTTTTITYND
jgi:hypothetical protein